MAYQCEVPVMQAFAHLAGKDLMLITSHDGRQYNINSKLHGRDMLIIHTVVWGTEILNTTVCNVVVIYNP